MLLPSNPTFLAGPPVHFLPIFFEVLCSAIGFADGLQHSLGGIFFLLHHIQMRTVVVGPHVLHKRTEDALVKIIRCVAKHVENDNFRVDRNHVEDARQQLPRRLWVVD